MKEFKQINKAIAKIAKEMGYQMSQHHMSYDIEWDGKKMFDISGDSPQELKDLVIRSMLSDAINSAIEQSLRGFEQVDTYIPDPWSRIKGFMALRLAKEEVQSPLSAEEYEEIKVTAEKSKALDLDSVYVNNQRPEWTEAEQMELLMKKEKE